MGGEGGRARKASEKKEPGSDGGKLRKEGLGRGGKSIKGKGKRSGESGAEDKERKG